MVRVVDWVSMVCGAFLFILRISFVELLRAFPCRLKSLIRRVRLRVFLLRRRLCCVLLRRIIVMSLCRILGVSLVSRVRLVL